jgi:3-oxoacyl-[acyl-carrier-protein] synthase II
MTTANRRASTLPSAQRVVVTGLGAVCGWGAGTDTLWEGLLGAGTAITPLRRFDAARYRTRLAAEVPGELGDGGVPARTKGAASRERLSLADRFALVAAGEAVAQAGLAPPADTRSAGVFFGSSTGGMWESERYFAHLLRLQPGRPRLGWVTSQQYNGPGDAVARWVKAQGPVETVSSACTSGSLAIAAAADTLREGEVELAIAGGSDSLCQLTYAGFNSLRAVDAAPCRPFRRDREGMSLGEGAAVLVLETLARARARGARPIAELLAGASSCDAHHMTAPAPDGRGAVCAIRRALGEAGIGADAVDFVNAHGTGTPLNDAAEWQALLQTLGSRAASVPVAAPKGSVGHLLGAAGALEAVATVLCLQRGCIHPTPAGGAVDEAAAAPLVLGEALRNGRLDVGLSINLAFGGSNAALLFARWDEAA